MKVQGIGAMAASPLGFSSKKTQTNKKELKSPDSSL